MAAIPSVSPAHSGLLFLYDVCEEIRLDDLRAILGVQPAGREPSFRQPTPEYVRFQKPPVIEYLEPLVLESGERLQRQLHYYEYGVVSIELQLPFEFDWQESDPPVESLDRGAGNRKAGRRQCPAQPGTRPPGAGEALQRMADRGLLHHSASPHRPQRPAAARPATN